MQRVFDFLGLSGYVSDSYVKHNPSASKTEMDPAIEEHLTNLFRPHNQRLFEHLGIEFPWAA
jgi:hypothetical protein